MHPNSGGMRVTGVNPHYPSRASGLRDETPTPLRPPRQLAGDGLPYAGGLTDTFYHGMERRRIERALAEAATTPVTAAAPVMSSADDEFGVSATPSTNTILVSRKTRTSTFIPATAIDAANAKSRNTQDLVAEAVRQGKAEWLHAPVGWKNPPPIPVPPQPLNKRPGQPNPPYPPPPAIPLSVDMETKESLRQHGLHPPSIQSRYGM